MFDYLKKPMPVLVFVFAALNLLDYLTTVYAFKTVPNVYEMNFELADQDLMFWVKMINTNITIFFGLIIALILEKLKNADTSFKICYCFVFCLMMAVIVEYTLTVANNTYVILTHSNLESVKAILEHIPKYHEESDYVTVFLRKISELPNLFE